jgi:hypothetical protein
MKRAEELARVHAGLPANIAPGGTRACRLQEKEIGPGRLMTPGPNRFNLF